MQFEGLKSVNFCFLTGCEEELLASQNEYGSKSTVIVKLKGDLDVMLSPLVLESLQRYVQYEVVLCEMMQMGS
jgi:hypothetical protein